VVPLKEAVGDGTNGADGLQACSYAMIHTDLGMCLRHGWALAY